MFLSARRQMARRLSPLAAVAIAAPALLAPATALAGSCGVSSAHEAFDVQGLKSELMVTALSCNAQDRYNAFVGKFRPTLAVQEERLNSYFRTTYGKNAKTQHDDYITQLANVQSEGGLRAGTIFCMQRVAMFDEVNALEGSTDLANYAEAKDIVQPASYEVCAADLPPSSASSRHGGRSSSSRHRTRA